MSTFSDYLRCYAVLLENRNVMRMFLCGILWIGQTPAFHDLRQRVTPRSAKEVSRALLRLEKRSDPTRACSGPDSTAQHD